MSTVLSIIVCYALPDRQTLISLELPQGATLRQAIDASGILQRHPEIDLTKQKVGVFGKHFHVLRRIEIDVVEGHSQAVLFIVSL